VWGLGSPIFRQLAVGTKVDSLQILDPLPSFFLRMYRILKETSERTSRELSNLMGSKEPGTGEVVWSGSGLQLCLPQLPSKERSPVIDTETERRRLLSKLQTSSMSNFGSSPGGGAVLSDEQEEAENKSASSARSMRSLWQRTRSIFQHLPRKASKKGRFRFFRKRQKTKTADYSHVGGQSSMQDFFEMDTRSTASEPLATKKSRLFGGRQMDRDGHETRSVISQKSLPTLRRPMFPAKNRVTTKPAVEENPVHEFSVEIQASNRPPRPKLTHEGSSFIRRIFSSKRDIYVSANDSWHSAYSDPFSDRLTPTTMASEQSDTEDEDCKSATGYQSDDEWWEEEPAQKEYDFHGDEDDDDDEDITQFFRPIDPPSEHRRRSIPDRWSPSPSPSTDAESAPKLPTRRPMQENTSDDPQPKQFLARKDNNVIFPAPAPIRLEAPKATNSGDSSILSLLSNIVASWGGGEDHKCDMKVQSVINEDELGREDSGSPTKGILKTSSGAVVIPSYHPIKARRTVSFDRILIREYEQVLGDNPSCGSGPPIS
jgi:hypothetical protein